MYMYTHTSRSTGRHCYTRFRLPQISTCAGPSAISLLLQ